MMPLDEIKLLCAVTSTGTPKKEVCFFKFSVWVFLVVSTNNVPFFNFLTDLAVPIIDSICFSITNGESEVTGFFFVFRFDDQVSGKVFLRSKDI